MHVYQLHALHPEQVLDNWVSSHFGLQLLYLPGVDLP
jgi:hypothetical protein